MSSSNSIDGADDNHQDQEETRELHPDDLGQLEQDEEEPRRDGNVGEGFAPRCKKLTMHDHNLPVQFPSMLSSNHFDNLIRRREVHHIPRAHVPSGWDIQRDTVSSAARKDVWGSNNYEILQAQKHTSMLVQVLIDHINQLTKVVEKHIQACDKKPPPPDKDEA
ncbi:hypothetical protein VPH35_118375 [Triticum aestivum]